MRATRGQREAARRPLIISRFFTAAHSLSYDLQTKLIPFFEKQCVTMTNDSSGGYDFKKAEAMIIDRYLAGLPVIDLEQKLFVFSHEQVFVTCISLTNMLLAAFYMY